MTNNILTFGTETPKISYHSNPINIISYIQGSPEWLKSRAGHFSGSTANELMMSDDKKGFQDLINKIAIEKITGQPVESEFSNFYMQRGTQLEPEARSYYEYLTFNKVDQIGFAEINEFVGVSVDGLIGSKSIIEIKCPGFATHTQYLLELEPIPKKYILQMQFGLYVLNREMCIFLSYYPKVKPLIKEIKRDDNLIIQIKERLNYAINLVQERIIKLRENYD